MKEDLIAESLFGNEAGEDEDIQILNSYFVEKMEFDRFYSPKNRFLITQSRKGVGKSTLLKKTLYMNQKKGNTLSLYLKGSDLVALQEISRSSPNELIHGWQQRICTRINHEIGRRINIALRDDSIALVEASELAGFKERNLVSCLSERLKTNIVKADKTSSLLASQNAIELLTRYSKSHDMTVWFYIDDIDATFLNKEKQKLELSTFFSACRNLVNSVKGLVIRAAVRTDVWTILDEYDEALDKCRQYIVPLNWSASSTGEILERKIISYFRRTYPRHPVCRLEVSKTHRNTEIIHLIISPIFPWGKRTRPSYKVIHLLSNGRPRWAAQLCKMAGHKAFEDRKDQIQLKHIDDIMSKYGQYRLDDLYREHNHQCSHMERVIESFAGGYRRYNTHNFMDRIMKKIVRRYGPLKIDGIDNVQGTLGIAHFLYRIGFIQGCSGEDNLDDEPTSFEDRPDLLKTDINLDDGLDWEIHPSYRKVLRIR